VIAGKAMIVHVALRNDNYWGCELMEFLRRI
jgi:hypothetical protein